MQEVLNHQLLDLLAALNASAPPCESGPQWAYIGAGRDDGDAAGEYVPIFYRPSVWELREHTVEWLSPEPRKKGWDAGSIRIVTIAILAHRATKQEILVMNTHLDNEGIVARRESAHMLHKLAKEWSSRMAGSRQKAAGFGLILTGDLNSDDSGDAYKILEANVGCDARNKCVEAARYGEDMTFTGFLGKKSAEERIDYVFIGPKGQDESIASVAGTKGVMEGGASDVKGYAVLPNKFEDGNVYYSDHRAVVADLELSE